MENNIGDEIFSAFSKIKPVANEVFDAHKQKSEQFITDAVYRDLLKRSEISPRHEDAKIIKEGQWWIECQKVLAMVCKGRGATVALVSNKRGSGKTQIGCEAIKLACSKGRTAFFTSALTVLMQVRASYNGGAKSELDVMHDHTAPSLLVIDEFGRRKGNDFEDGTFFHIMNTRYNHFKDTILISNDGAEKFMSDLGPSLASRLVETGGIIECEWDSFRG